MRRFLDILICCILTAGCSSSAFSPRERMDFNDGWRFQLGDVPEASCPDFDDSGWRVLDLPHDWAVEGDFSIDNPSGTGGGALPGGIGWYRKTFGPSSADSDRLWRIDFDGVYMNAEVFVNGESLGVRPYGYISFGYDITPLLKWDAENVIAVRVDNAEQPNSRWYSGCGIYRNVWMTKTGSLRVAPNGVYVIPCTGTHDVAYIFVQTDILTEGDMSERILLRQSVIDASGKEVTSVEDTVSVEESSGLEQEIELLGPHHWSVDNPYLYTVVTEIESLEGRLLDRYETRCGIRCYQFRPDEGFSLNGRPMKINGVCLHHDFGCLGAAFNINAARRQLEILRDMGCNAIRTSHNPPAPQLLDLCDELGFIVQDEAFDMWRKKKTAHDYSRYFNEWHERDLTDFIVRDRNHPSIMMWSIGNEVLEQWSHADADTLSLAEANLILNFGHSSDMLSAEGEEMSVNSPAV